MTPDQLAKLPKWARDHIASLEEQLASVNRGLLRQAMSDASEEFYSAGWHMGLEYDLWRAITTDDASFGIFWGATLSRRDIADLKQLSEAAGGWFVWRDDEAQFVPMAEWLEMYAAGERND